MERALYNNVLAGVSFEGDQFFYANPLTAYPHVNPHEPLKGIHEAPHYRREEWFFCPCCPPNLARVVASIGGYFYSTTPDRLYVHLYNPNTARFELGGQAVEIEQQTEYPWDGTVQIAVRTENPAQFALALCVPGWCRSYTLVVNDEPQTLSPTNGYLLIERIWHEGDTVTLVLDMPVERMIAHPDIREDAGRIALQRGPVVYCLEEVDNGARLANVAIPGDAALQASFDPDLFGGVSVISGEAVRLEPDAWPGEMYQPRAVVASTPSQFRFKAIPYALWANREPGEMRVWIREI
jgi:DUF1680 family protein